MAKAPAKGKGKAPTTTTTNPASEYGNLAGALATTGAPGVGSSLSGTGLTGSAPGNINVAQVPTQYQLDPNIANEVMAGAATGVPATTGVGVKGTGSNATEVAPKAPPVQATAERLLLAYSHLFGSDPEKEVTANDTALLDGLDKKANVGIAGVVEQLSTTGMGGAKGGGTVDRSKDGLDAQGQAVQNVWDSIFGGGKTSPINMNQVKTELATEITKKIPGLSTQDILKADPKNLQNLAVTPAMSEELQKQGVYIPVGQPISSAAERLGKSDSQIASAAAAPGPLTAQKQYSQLIAGYDAASVVDKSNKVKELTDAGLIPNPSNITEDDVAKAYKTLVTDAVNTKTDVATAQKNLVNGLKNNPNLQAAQNGQYASLVPQTADRLGVNLSQEQQDYLENHAQRASPWTAAQVDQAVSGYFKVPTDASGIVDVSQLSGDAASIYQVYQNILVVYELPMSNATIVKFTSQALQSSISGLNDSGGTETGADLSSGTAAATAAFQQYVQAQAEQLYPSFAPQIAGGATTNTLIETYAEVAAALLGNGTASGTGASAAQAQDAVTVASIDWSRLEVVGSGERWWTTNSTGGPAPTTLPTRRRSPPPD